VSNTSLLGSLLGKALRTGALAPATPPSSLANLACSVSGWFDTSHLVPRCNGFDGLLLCMEFLKIASTRAGGRGSGLVARPLTAVSRCVAVPSPRPTGARSTRPGNLSRAVAQPAPLRCALALREGPIRSDQSVIFTATRYSYPVAVVLIGCFRRGELGDRVPARPRLRVHHQAHRARLDLGVRAR
jgi:hypothetical protein